jgi:hypothetical protein
MLSLCVRFSFLFFIVPFTVLCFSLLFFLHCAFYNTDGKEERGLEEPRRSATSESADRSPQGSQDATPQGRARKD